MGYSGANVDVRPYGIVKHHFVAEFDNELGLNEGDMVYLLRYVDNEWLEAELDSSRRYAIFIHFYSISLIRDLVANLDLVQLVSICFFHDINYNRKV